MSSLDKLAIRGIRSFDDKDLSVMQFYSPLTVIVGHNGSGKTTIIESLKYACTGDLPPNTKGGAFVHDPNIAGTSEVKAQVKLRFFNVKKQKMIVERRLEVKRKKNISGLSMKTLEATISLDTPEDGDRKKRRTLSTKCASLDEEIAYQLGVSKAILENVIFCHQEESNWPLSEPSALKKKFDDIFEATKYTKALDQLKTLRKDYTTELKVDQEKVKALRTDKERAAKLRKAIDDLSNQIEVKTSEFERLEEEITTLTNSNAKFYNQAAGYKDTLSRVETLNQRRLLLETNLEQIRSTLTVLEDSDAELRRKVDNHNEQIQTIRDERENDRLKLEDENDVLASNERKRSRAQTKHGQLLAEKERHATNLESRQALVRELSGRHAIPGFDHDLTEEEIAEFEDKLEASVVQHTSKIEQMKNEAKTAEGKKQQAIQALRSEKAADERAKLSMQQQKAAISARITQFNRQIDAVKTTVADMTYKESTLADEKRRLEDLEKSVREADYVRQLRDKTKELKDLEDTRDQLHVELAGLNSQSNVRAQLQLKRTELKKKEESIQSLLSKSASSCRKYTRAEPNRDSIEANVNAAIADMEKETAAAERSHKDVTKELQTIETSVSIAKRKLKSLQDQSNTLKADVEGTLRDHETDKGTIEEAITEADESLAEARDILQDAESMGQFFAQLLKRGQTRHVCQGCNRAIKDDEMAAFEAHCQKMMTRNPQKITEAQDNVQYWTEQLAKLRKALPAEVSLQKLLTDDIPTAEAEVEEATTRLAPQSNRAEASSNRVAELAEEMRELQQLRRVANDVARLSRECDDVSRDITKLESELQASGSTATADEIQAQLAEIGNHIRANKSESDKLRAEQQSLQAKISSLSSSIHATELDLAKTQQDLKDKEALEQRKQAEADEICKINTQLQDVGQRLIEADLPINKLEDELKDLQSRFAQRERTAATELQAYNKSCEKLNAIKREINSYEARGIANELLKCEHDLRDQEKVIANSKSRIAQLQIQVSQKEKQLADSNAVLRNFQDNLRLRTEQKQLQEIDTELESLDEEGARRAYRDFETKYHTSRQKQTAEQARQAKIAGELEMMKKEMSDKRKEIEEEYKDVDKQFVRELIKSKVTEAAGEDLFKYSKALDAAIMRFHGLKMAEINDTIADLWTKTYQGTDIDKIMIKSDAEGKISGTKTSYNYRARLQVVMFKDTTEMDMRGRCSAGQKVLASIIIRLALAESFGVNCGVMALDEPTTNLDQDNIEALGRSLSDIIKERRAQSNFQLIVITHDENLLNQLGQTGALDKYFRVSRGDGGQVSKIERQRLT
ncbi:DNA repair protein rad50 [Microbotryomycetes sp. JL201]|nr:DNA repair protein rad50 [Microbotryomycetes sp. JL201]